MSDTASLETKRMNLEESAIVLAEALIRAFEGNFKMFFHDNHLAENLGSDRYCVSCDVVLMIEFIDTVANIWDGTKSFEGALCGALDAFKAGKSNMASNSLRVLNMTIDAQKFGPERNLIIERCVNAKYVYDKPIDVTSSFPAGSKGGAS